MWLKNLMFSLFLVFLCIFMLVSSMCKGSYSKSVENHKSRR